MKPVIFITLILLLPVLTKDASFCVKYDNQQQAWPWMNKMASAIHQGHWPTWDANTYGGRNFIGEMDTGVYYPLNIIWCLVFGSAHGIDVWYLDLLIALHYLIAAIGMYMVGRLFQLSAMGATAAALIFTFTGELAARSGAESCIFYGLSYLPWAVWFTGKYYLESRSRWFLGGTGVMIGLQILAGHLEPSFHTMIILLGVALYYGYHQNMNWRHFTWSVFLDFTIVGVIALVLAIPQLHYSVYYLAHSYRWVNGGQIIPAGQDVPIFIYAYWFIFNLSNFTNFFHQQYIWDYDSNNIYIGILPLFLLLLYIIWYRKLRVSAIHSTLSKFLFILLIVSFISALGYQTLFHLLLWLLPFVSTASRQLGRYLILFSFSASLLVGITLSYLPEIKDNILGKSKPLLYVLLFLTLNEVYLCVFQQKDISLSVSIPFLLTFLFLLLVRSGISMSYLSALAILLIAVDLYVNPVNFVSTSSSLYPPAYYKRDRIINFLETTYGKYRVSYDVENNLVARRNIGDVYNIQTDFGFGATANEAYFNFWNFKGGIPSEQNDLLNIRYILTDHQLDSNYIFRDSTITWQLYERKTWYPRIYWKHQLGLSGAKIESDNQDKIRQLDYRDKYQKFQVTCDTPDSLIFSENCYPGWRYYDDGKELPISAAAIKNYPPVFRCIWLSAGTHLIEFKYD